MSFERSHDVEVYAIRDSLDVSEAVDLPDSPVVDVRTSEEARMPEGPIQTVPYRIAAFPVVTDIEHDLAVPSVLN